MSGERLRTLSEISHLLPALACAGSDTLCGTYCWTKPDMDAALAVPRVCAAHSTLLALSHTQTSVTCK